MKRLSFLLLGAMSLQSYAQTSATNTVVQPFEGEVFLGVTCPITPFFELNPYPDFNVGVEVRYNLKAQPVSMGLLIEESHTAYRKGHTDDGQGNRTLLCALSGDWNFRQGQKVNPFVGLAAGAGYLTNPFDYVEYADRTSHAVFIPRVGVELGYHFRTHLECLIVRKGFSNIGLSIGANIGGRPRKNK